MWQDKANCKEINPDVFFSAKKKDKALALATCEPCVVKRECLAFALACQSIDGIYGATTGEQRRKMLVGA